MNGDFVRLDDGRLVYIKSSLGFESSLSDFDKVIGGTGHLQEVFFFFFVVCLLFVCLFVVVVKSWDCSGEEVFFYFYFY